MRKTISPEEMKKVELDILKKVAKICNDNNLRYCLASGTLLGAVRHKGFIPWDDDIDINMPRADYMRFLDIMDKNKYENLKAVSLYNSEDYPYNFSKVIDTRTVLIEDDITGRKEIGVYIDIFPMDGLPSDIESSNKHYKKIRFYNTLRGLSVSKFVKSSKWYKTVPRFLLYKLSRAIGHRAILKRVDKIAMKYDFDKCEFAGVAVAGYGARERIHRDGFAKFINMQFEDGYFNAPAGYEEYLSSLYGDYMKLPPEEKRVTHHNFEAYWR